jgi:hypothetical protein
MTMELEKNLAQTVLLPPGQKRSREEFHLFLTDTVTGEEREVETITNWRDERYLWEEGNRSCDCNRSIFYTGAASGDMPCGRERFTLRVTNRKGKTVYEEIRNAD